jgi:hypothetical protein
MNTYTFTEARQKLASLLEQASRSGEVRIKRRDGQIFIVRPQKRIGSPLDVKGVKLGLTRQEILESIEEGRKAGVLIRITNLKSSIVNRKSRLLCPLILKSSTP